MEILGLLESTIGLVLIYLVLSLIGSAWVEAIVNWTGLRGENLRKLIEIQCGGDEQIANLLLAQSQLRALYAPSQSISRFGRFVRRMLALCFDRGQSQQKSGFRPPSYIPPLRFARALSDMALGDDVERLRNAPELIERRLSEPNVLAQLRRCCDQTRESARRGEVPIRAEQCRPDDDSLKKAASHISKVLTRLWHQAGGDTEAFVKQIAKWFEDGNDRASGWFKRKLAPMLFAVGLVLAFALNVDSIQILSRLSGDAEMRRSLVMMAVDKVENMPADIEESVGELKAEFDRAKQALLEMEPLVGWRASSFPTEAGYGEWVLWSLSKLIGLLVTAIALSLGAPFWFEILRKLVRARTSISQLDAEETVAGQPATPAGAAAPTADSRDSPTRPSGAGRTTDAEPRLQSGMAGLALDAQAPDRLNARWMARLSNLAYSGRAQAEQELKDMELRLDHWMDSHADQPNAGIGHVDTQGFIASNRDLTMVVFRGTEVNLANPADVLTDLKARMTEIDWFPDEPKPRAHRGFLLALDAVWAALEQQLKALAAANPVRPVWFTGHSLGGALAVLAATRYSIWRERENLEREKRADQLLEQLGETAEGAPDNEARAAVMHLVQREATPLPPCGWIYTIGQPAVGNQRLADWLETHFGQRLVRTINNRDIVPRLPTPILGYVQAGVELYFDSFGRMKINPGAWYRSLDTLLSDPEHAREQALEAFGDHKAETYIALLNEPKAQTA